VSGGPGMMVYPKVAAATNVPRRSDQLSKLFVAGDYGSAMLPCWGNKFLPEKKCALQGENRCRNYREK